MYASSATIRFQGMDRLSPGSPSAQRLHDSIERVAKSTELRAATSVQPLRGVPGQHTLTLVLTYRNRNPNEAERVTERIAAALAADGAGAASADVLDPPTIPTRMPSNYRVTIATGGIAGLIAGAIAAVLWRYRRPAMAPKS
jgi:predicted component of type VI protein secretion system